MTAIAVLTVNLRYREVKGCIHTHGEGLDVIFHLRGDLLTKNLELIAFKKIEMDVWFS